MGGYTVRGRGHVPINNYSGIVNGIVSRTRDLFAIAILMFVLTQNIIQIRIHGSYFLESHSASATFT